MYLNPKKQLCTFLGNISPFTHALQPSPVSDRVGTGISQDRKDETTQQGRPLANRACGCEDISLSKASPRAGPGRAANIYVFTLGQEELAPASPSLVTT